MTQQILALTAQYGMLLVFLSVLAEQLGAPVPSPAILVVAGALASAGQMSLPAVLLAALLACLLGDLIWFWAGRHFGARALRTLCRVSLSPDSCVHQSELRFERWREQILLVSKFIPGLSLIAPPLMGALGLRLRVFVLFDGLGSLLWAGTALGLGYVFAAQIDRLLADLATAGTIALGLVLGVFALFVLGKWWRRRCLLVALRMARITAEELNRALRDGRTPLVFDVRSATSRQLDPRIITGALLADLDHLDQAIHGVPSDRMLVIYCNCPNEATSARAAKSLIVRGYKDVRPLQGGLDAWCAAGYGVQRLPVAG